MTRSLPEGLPVHAQPGVEAWTSVRGGGTPRSREGPPEGVVTDCMEVAGVRVHPAQGGAFLFYITNRCTLRGVSRNEAL